MRTSRRAKPWFKHMLTACLVCCASTLTFACQQELSPEESLRSFLNAVSAGDTDTSWSLLSEQSRQALEARAKVTRTSIGGETKPEDFEAKTFLTGVGLLKTYQIDSIERSEQGTQEGRIVLILKAQKTVEEIEMIHQEGTWRVGLKLPPGPANP